MDDEKVVKIETDFMPDVVVVNGKRFKQVNEAYELMTREGQWLVDRLHEVTEASRISGLPIDIVVDVLRIEDVKAGRRYKERQ